MKSVQPQNPSVSVGISLQQVVVSTGPASIAQKEQIISHVSDSDASLACKPQQSDICFSLSAVESQSNSKSLEENPYATATTVEHNPSSSPAAIFKPPSLQKACKDLINEVRKNPCAAGGLEDKWESAYNALQDTDLWPGVPDGLTWRHVWLLNAAYYEFVLFQEFDKARQLLKDMLSNNNVVVVLFVTIVYTAAVNPANGVAALVGAQVGSPGTSYANTTSIQFTYDGFNPVSAIMLIMYTLGYALALISIVGGIGVIFLLGPIWNFENFRDTNPMWGSLLHLSVLAFMFSMYVFLGAHGVSVWQLYATPSFSVAVAVLVLVYSITLLVQWAFIEVLTYKMSGLSARLTQKQLQDQYLLKLAGKTWPLDMDTMLQVVSGAMGMCETLEWLEKDPNTTLDKFFDAFVFYRATVLHGPEARGSIRTGWISKSQTACQDLLKRVCSRVTSLGSSQAAGSASLETSPTAGSSISV